MSGAGMEEGDCSGRHILVVDDDDDVREAIRFSLEVEGYAIEAAANGREAMTSLRAGARPCLVLLDLMMPEMDGWATIEALESDRELARIPVVVITAFGGDLGRAVHRQVLRKPIRALVAPVGSGAELRRAGVTMTVAATPRAEALAGAALQASKFLVAVVDADGRIVHANPALERATGRQGDDLRGAPLMDIVGIAEEKASVRAACAQLGSGRFPPAMFFHLVTGASELRVVDWSNVVLPRDAGAPPVAVCIGIELSQRTETNQLLRKTEERQRLLLERIPAVVWTTDCALRFTSSVGGALAQLGLSPDQVAAVGTSLYAYFQTDDSTNPVIAAHLAALRGECSNLDTVWLGRTFQLRVEPLRDPTGAMIGTIGVALDVTERRRMEVSLRDNEGRLRRIVDANVIGILFWRGPQILDANRAFLDMVGFTAEEIAAGRVSWRELTPPEYAAHDERAMRELAERGIFTPFEKEYFHKDGTRVPILLGGAIFEGTNDEGIAFVLDLREEVTAAPAARRSPAAGAGRLARSQPGPAPAPGPGRGQQGPDPLARARGDAREPGPAARPGAGRLVLRRAHGLGRGAQPDRDRARRSGARGAARHPALVQAVAGRPRRRAPRLPHRPAGRIRRHRIRAALDRAASGGRWWARATRSTSRPSARSACGPCCASPSRGAKGSTR